MDAVAASGDPPREAPPVQLDDETLRAALRDHHFALGRTARALRISRKLQCGQVFVNNYGAGGGIELPFGGTKRSGHGREKGLLALCALLGRLRGSPGQQAYGLRAKELARCARAAN